MAAIWVVAQHRQGQLHKMTLEALAAGQKLAAEIGAEVEAVVLGGADVATVAEELRGCAVAGVRLAATWGYPEFHGLVFGLLTATAFSSAAFHGWLALHLRRARAKVVTDPAR